MLLLVYKFNFDPEQGGAVMHLQESGEMYLETIYILSKTHSVVRSIDVGEYMGYSKPSVSRAVGILKQGGYVIMNREGYLSLTDSGLEVAKKSMKGIRRLQIFSSVSALVRKRR